MSKLNGMKEICGHVKRSEATVLGWIMNYGFPAEKDLQAEIFVAGKKDVERWTQSQAAVEAGFVASKSGV